jgi:hypothetical protein
MISNESLKQKNHSTDKPGQKVKPIFKITKAIRAWGLVQVVECLPSKCKAMSSNPSNAKKEKKSWSKIL